MNTFREKVQARWPHYDDRRGVFRRGATQDEMRRVASETQLDCKLTCRSHLQAYAEYLPKLYFEGNPADIDFAKLPARYVIKPRCQTGVLMLMDHGVDLKTGRPVDNAQIRAFFEQQWCYRGLNNDVLIEEMIENRDGSPCVSQFKCLTFHGRVEYIHYVSVGYDLGCIAYDYDRDWNRVALYHSAQPVERGIARPVHFPMVIALAEHLAEYYRNWTGIEHVRVDLFDSDKGPVFGEYAGGTNGGEGFTEDAQILLGSLW
ncbi:BulA [Paraburkholderia acidicola]|uniref:BulA n=1 Tax=Paraburkholderia acidicola TaxID=1912599 RepID=A0A2A4EQI6_9BURK|nr:ATP-grasp fold amidoligase family protein [Paraburkholderia acidicola]PCE22682.1 BulA [Paraburkholderia acidicola]